MSERGHRNATRHTNATHQGDLLVVPESTSRMAEINTQQLQNFTGEYRLLPVVRWPVGAVGESPTQNVTPVELTFTYIVLRDTYGPYAASRQEKALGGQTESSSLTAKSLPSR